jgi:hypothetical protein
MGLRLPVILTISRDDEYFRSTLRVDEVAHHRLPIRPDTNRLYTSLFQGLFSKRNSGLPLRRSQIQSCQRNHTTDDDEKENCGE